MTQILWGTHFTYCDMFCHIHALEKSHPSIVIDRALFSKHVPVLKFLGNFMCGKTYFVHVVHAVFESLDFSCAHVLHVKYLFMRLLFHLKWLTAASFVYPPNPPCVQSM